MRHAQDADVLVPANRRRSLGPLRLSVPVAAAVVIVDQLTKRWALNTLVAGPCDGPESCIDLVAGIRFHLVFNTGAAFTRGSAYGPLLAVLAFVMAGVLLLASTRRTDRWGIILFGAIAGGAVGNLIDRMFRATDGLFSGAVVDFIDLGWWPVFNVADSAIVVGVVMVLVLTFFDGRTAADDPVDRDTPSEDGAGGLPGRRHLASNPAQNSHPDSAADSDTSEPALGDLVE